MYLMDCVAQAPPGLRINDYFTGRQILLPGAGMFREEIAGLPVRYILDDAVTAACADMVANRQDFLADALDIVRAPFGEFWIEWTESIRAEIFADPSEDGSPCVGGRAGMLVNTDETGRAGVIRIFWSEDGQSADINPAILRFDLDASPVAGPDISLRVRNPDMQSLFDKVWIDIDPDWDAYYRQRARSQSHLRGILSKAVGPAAFDFPFLLSFALLLMARSHDMRPSDLSALNRSRTRKGRPALLDHLTVTQQILGEAGRQGVGTSPTDRASPRLHLVRGHLVRRGDTVFWRTSHFRGSSRNAPLRKTVSLVLRDAA